MIRRISLMAVLLLASTLLLTCCKQTRTTTEKETDSLARTESPTDSAPGNVTDTASRGGPNAPRTDLTEARTDAAASSRIAGRVEIWEGNFMPPVDPARRDHQITPAAGRRVRVHDPVTMDGGMAEAKRASVPTRLVAETTTDAQGRFAVAVPPGTYSIFVEEDGGWYYNGWSEKLVQGEVTVTAGRTSDVLIKITTKAAF